jgi:hypothetical protein
MADESGTPPSNNSFNKEEFNSYVKAALSQIASINEAYKKLFEAPEGKEAIVKEIETRLQGIKDGYENLFSPNETGITKLGELNSKIDEIKKFHEELLAGEASIKVDIKESQDKITDFYVYLFGGEGEEGKEQPIKTAVDKILNFHTDLTKEDGYKNAIETAHQEILKIQEDLFLKDAEGNNKISLLNKDIEEIKTFRESVDKDIKPFIKNASDDINSKRKDAAALLRQATGGALVDGFLKSKREYQGLPNIKKLNGSAVDNVLNVFYNVFISIFSLIVFLVDYILFIFPLLLSVFIFTHPEMIASFIGDSFQQKNISDFLSGLNFYGRLIISLPLWWISWFGQRSIYQKRRLAEEYNHKAQVTTMYLNFVSEDTEKSYPLDDNSKKQLNEELINVIARHPGKVYGRDETILDKIIQVVLAWRGVKLEGEEDDKPSKA